MFFEEVEHMVIMAPLPINLSADIAVVELGNFVFINIFQIPFCCVSYLHYNIRSVKEKGLTISVKRI